MIFIAGFIIGIIYTLLIFNLNIAILPTFPIDASLVINFFIALGTVGAVLVALFKSSILSNWFGYKADLKIIEPLENIQGAQGCTRIRFENKGKLTATDVEVYVSNIYDNNRPRKEFIPVPLYWTHVGKTKRDFHPHQYGFLDLCRIDVVIEGIDVESEKKRYYSVVDPKLTIEGGAQVSTYEDIYQKTNKVELTIFQKSGEIKKVDVHITWKRPDPFVKIITIENKR